MGSVRRMPRRAGLPLFCGSYPITPATVILEELAKRKDLGVKTVQAEDEIAGICTAIGAVVRRQLRRDDHLGSRVFRSRARRWVWP